MLEQEAKKKEEVLKNIHIFFLWVKERSYVIFVCFKSWRKKRKEKETKRKKMLSQTKVRMRKN